MELHVSEKDEPELPEINPGDDIEYWDGKSWTGVELIARHIDQDGPYYSIKIPDEGLSFRERQTIRRRLRLKKRSVRFSDRIEVQEYIPDKEQPVEQKAPPPQPPMHQHVLRSMYFPRQASVVRRGGRAGDGMIFTYNK